MVNMTGLQYAVSVKLWLKREMPHKLLVWVACIYVMHTNCFVSHIKSFPPNAAPAGYIFPSCSAPIWPPKSIKDSSSQLHQLLKEAILQTGVEKNLFGNYPGADADACGPPAQTAGSDGVGESSIISLRSGSGGVGSSKFSESEIVEIDVPGPAPRYMKSSSPVRNFTVSVHLTLDKEPKNICLA